MAGSLSKFQAVRTPDMPFVLGEASLRHENTDHAAMVITPRLAMVIGRARVEQLRGSSTLSPVERWLIDEVRRRGERARVVLFRGVNDKDERVWRIDDDFSDDELDEAGYVFSKALLPLHRAMLIAGVVLMVHTDWGIRECRAMRYGIQRLFRECERVASPTPMDELDRWILRHMLLYVGLSLDHVLRDLLPDHLTMVERRWPSVRALVAQLPPHP